MLPLPQKVLWDQQIKSLKLVKARNFQQKVKIVVKPQNLMYSKTHQWLNRRLGLHNNKTNTHWGGLNGGAEPFWLSLIVIAKPVVLTYHMFAS